MVMRRVYQLFRCRLLIKHHQTLNLLTINALIHYLPFSLHLSLFSFPLGLCLPLLFFPLSVSLYQTPPNAGQINYLMHLSLSARAQSNLPLSLFTHKKKKSGLTHEEDSSFFLCHFLREEKGFFFFFLDSSLSPISPELIKVPSMCCKRLIC